MAELGGGNGPGGKPPWLGQLFYGAEYEDEDDGQAQVALAEEQEFNTVQPTDVDIDLYAFVESIEPVYAAPGDDGQLPDPAPVGYWIELDCIDCLFFDEVMANTSNYDALDPQALDNISDTSANAIATREALWDELLDSDDADDARATIYVYVTGDHPGCDALLADFPIGTWRKVAINTDEGEVTASDLEDAPTSNTLAAFLAGDPYTDTFQPLRAFGGRFLPKQPYDQLNEVFSLNHVPDIDLPDDGGGGGASGPLPVPSPNFPPPFLEFATQDDLLRDYEFTLNGENWATGSDALARIAAHFWGDDFATAPIQIQADPDNDRYIMHIGDYVFFTRAETDHAVWHGPGFLHGQWRLHLIQDADTGILLPETHCRLYQPPSPQPGFASALEWPPSPIRYEIKV